MSAVTTGPVRQGAALPSTTPTGRTAVRLVVWSSLLAAATHLWVVPEHRAEWPPAAIFFVVVTVLQVALAWWTHRSPSPLVVTAGLVGTVGLLVFYVLTRTVALPFLPAHGAEHLPVAWGVGNGIPIFPEDRIEAVGLPDMVCLVAELVTVAALCSLAAPSVRRAATNGLLLLGVSLLALRLVGVLG